MDYQKFFANKNVVYELSRKQIKTQYRGSWLGFLWTILNPLLTMLVMWLVFTEIFGKGDPYYPLYLLTGNILFTALRNSTNQSLQSIVNNRNLLLRTKIEPRVFPLSNVASCIINFGFSLIALIPFMIWLSISRGINLFTYRLLFLLLMIPAYAIFIYGLGLFLCSIFVFFRDLKHIYSVLLVLWNYLTPIFYKPEVIAKNNPAIYTVLKINPMFHFLDYFRDCIYRGAAGVNAMGQTVEAFLPNWSTLGICYICAIASLLLGIIIFKSLKAKLIVRI